MSLPYLLARALARDRPLRLTERTLDATGDWLSAVDVAAASRALLFRGAARAPRLQHRVRAAHAGHRAARGGADRMPRGEIAVTGAADADVDMDPSLRRARWNAYAIERVRAATGWSPRPLGDQLGEYLRWALADPSGAVPDSAQQRASADVREQLAVVHRISSSRDGRPRPSPGRSCRRRCCGRSPSGGRPGPSVSSRSGSKTTTSASAPGSNLPLRSSPKTSAGRVQQESTQRLTERRPARTPSVYISARRVSMPLVPGGVVTRPSSSVTRRRGP